MLYRIDDIEAIETIAAQNCTIKVGSNTQFYLYAVCDLGSPLSINYPNAKIELFYEEYPYVKSIQLNINTKNTNVVLGDRYITLYGNRYIEDILCDVKFYITPESFYQVNHDGAQILYSLAKDKALNEKLAAE